jgi:sigma-E factor negative regulatory protein RseC
MTEMPGVVIRIEDGHAVVEIGPRAVGCGRCQEPGGCGAPTMSTGSAKQKRQYRLPNDIGVGLGDDVVLAMADGALLKVALLAYLLPVALLIAGAAIGATLSPSSDSLALSGAAVGLGLGLVALRWAQTRMSTAREPLLSMHIKDCNFQSHKEISSC